MNIKDKSIFRHFALRLDMKSKMEFYGRLRDMVRKHRQKRWDEFTEKFDKMYTVRGKLYGAEAITNKRR